MKNTIKKYSTNEFQFREIVSQYLDITDEGIALENLHEYHKFEERLTSSKGNAPDQKQVLHRKFYNQMDEDPLFKRIYDRFVKRFLTKAVNFQFIYQRFPTFRIHQPDNVGVFEFHKDRDYGHSPEEINIFMPITKAFGTNTVWAESEEGKADYAPMEIDYGEIVLWDGPNLKHGSKINTTNQTRVSFDFRILPLKHYNPDNESTSVSKGRAFRVGDYFESF